MKADFAGGLIDLNQFLIETAKYREKNRQTPNPTVSRAEAASTTVPTR